MNFGNRIEWYGSWRASEAGISNERLVGRAGGRCSPPPSNIGEEWAGVGIKKSERWGDGSCNGIATYGTGNSGGHGRMDSPMEMRRARQAVAR